MPGVPRGNALARFLGSFFAAWQRMNIKSNPRSAWQYARQKKKSYQI
jgi:hypothetical protein